MENLAIRERRIQVFEDMLQLCERERDLLEGIVLSREGISLWENLQREEREACFLECLCRGSYNKKVCKLGAPNKDVLEYIRELQKNNPSFRVGLLFHTTTPCMGGNVLRGGTGLAETLYRCTTLYPCLNQEVMQAAYQRFRALNQAALCIYVPQVICVGNDEITFDPLSKEDWFSFDIFQCISSHMHDGDSEIIVQLEE